LLDAARAVAFLQARFRGVEGDILICALPEPRGARGAGRAREYRLERPVDPARIREIFAKEDKPHRGLFFCVGTIKADAVKSAKGSWRTKANIWRVPGPHADLDFKDLELGDNPTATVTRQLGKSPWAPRPRVLTGGGMHGYWRCATPVGPEDFDQLEQCMRVLAYHFGADPSVVEVSRLMRLPGSVNWKYGEPRPVVQALAGNASIDIWDEEVGAGEPVLERLDGPEAPGANAFEAYAAAAIPAPVDVEARLAAMDWHGAGDTSVHATQLSVTASLINAGLSRDEAIEHVLAATMQKPFANGWNAKAERRTLEGMCDTWLAKTAQPNGPTVDRHLREDPRPNGEHPSQTRPAWHLTPLYLREEESMPSREWLYGNHYVRKFMSCTIGSSGLGKSSLAIVEALAMATGRNLLGVDVEEPLRVWYHNGEDPMEEIERRFLAATKYYGISNDDIGERLFVTSGRDIDLKLAVTQLHKVVIDIKAAAQLKVEIRERKVDVAIFDPLTSMHLIDENDNVAMGALATLFGEIANDTDSAVELIHHSRKLAPKETVTIEHARGASSLIAATRAARVTNTMQPDEAATFKVTERRRYFRVENGKASMFVPIDSATWHETRSVRLNNGTPGFDNGDNVGVVAAWEPPDAFEDITPVMLAAALETARSGGPWREDTRSPHWLGHGIAHVLGLDPKSRHGRHRLKAVIDKWLVEKVVQAVRRQDEQARKIFVFLEAAR
jgi:hypothetical protein